MKTPEQWLAQVHDKPFLHDTENRKWIESIQADATRELCEALTGLLGMDELDMGDESILEQDEPNHPVILARKALANSTPPPEGK